MTGGTPMTQEITIWSWEAESSCSTGRDRGFISIYLSSTGSSASYWPRSKDLAAGGIRTTHAAVLDKALPEKWKWSEENPILLWWEKGKPPRKNIWYTWVTWVTCGWENKLYLFHMSPEDIHRQFPPLFLVALCSVLPWQATSTVSMMPLSSSWRLSTA